MPVTMTEFNNNKHKGLIYIYQHDLNGFEEFRSGLIEEHNLHDVVLASWIKPRTTFTKAVLITFKDGNIPEYIEIPGDQYKTKVYECISRPQICSKCLEFYHGAKYCKSPVQVCGKCGNAPYDRANCKNLGVKCHHCSENHFTGDKRCHVYKYEQEVLIIQTKQKVPRRQAIQVLENNNPSIKMDYLRAASGLGTGNANTTLDSRGRGQQATGDKTAEERGAGPEMKQIGQNGRTIDENKNKRSREEKDDAQVPQKKAKDVESERGVAEAVCVSSQTERVFTTTVRIENEDSELDQDEMTSENNPVLRHEVLQVFKRQTNEMSIVDQVLINLRSQNYATARDQDHHVKGVGILKVKRGVKTEEKMTRMRDEVSGNLTQNCCKLKTNSL